MEWLTENWDSLLAAAAGLHVFALFVVNLTPTPKDDAALAKAYRWVETVAGLVGKRAKE